ncbi:hypothetical protein KEG38_29300 [Polyangium jinanense]|uniref:hypothetical protein n=1 Tax=Polyangium jinanense TaxID=2829994 RepID=UPI0023421A27|nr:hypothetical protein [Polyangium jinanense]MDC3957989.1 hypothetical protein [Polyangium jinanense]
MRELRVAIVLSMLLAACGGDDLDLTPLPNDGKFRPPASGERTTEADACNTLVDAHSDRMIALGCVGSSRTCPGFLRAEFSAECLQYDKGSVDGCLEFYASKTTCQDLVPALEGCVITAYEGTTPAGCP